MLDLHFLEMWRSNPLLQLFFKLWVEWNSTITQLWVNIIHLPVNSIKHHALFLYFYCSITIPEKLEYFINKYAEHSHDKWSMDKVKVKSAIRIPIQGCHCEWLVTAQSSHPRLPLWMTECCSNISNYANFLFVCV